MDLLEYQGKQLFARHGVPVPAGSPAGTVEQAVAAADEIGYPCVVKAQVQIGGRGKAGGIKVAKDRTEAEAHAMAIIGMDIRGLTVHEVWIEAASDIAAEYYASIVFDRAHKRPLVLLSTQGGMDIEEVADKDPTAIARLHVDPLLGFQDFHARRLAFEAGVDEDVVRPIGALLNKLYDAFVNEEAMLVEVNPLIVTSDRQVAALDAKVTLDDNVGILGNGAGLVMSTLDVVAQAGGQPANFLDAGGGSRAEAITQAVEVILSNANVTAVLFNIFGGITRCDEVARGLIEAFNQINPTVPFGLIWLKASIRPRATSSQRVMPPKMLNSTAVTLALERITSTAWVIASAREPPPASRKFAGWPPAWATTSSVDMTRPAPLPRMPTLPSSLTKVRLRSRAIRSCSSSAATLRSAALSAWRKRLLSS